MKTETLMNPTREASPAADPQRVDAFAAKLMGMLNGAGLALMTSIGHRTGLFDAMAKLPPTTSDGISRATGLDERYVREWLGAMVAGEVVAHDPQACTYWLPAEHAACLTRAARPNNFAVPMQWLAVLGAAETGIVDCFRRGGGLSYASYPRFHEVMAEESDQTVVAGLFDHILPLAPGLVERLRQGVTVLDVGCGSGQALLALAEAFPRSRFVGRDASHEAVSSATERARSLRLPNVRFEVCDVAAMQDAGAFDVVTAFDAIHDQARPDLVLRAIARALRPDGVFLMQDIRGTSSHQHDAALPLGPFVYAISCMHCMSVSLGQRGMGLGAAWGERRARALLAETGFARVEKHELPHDVINDYYVCLTA